MSFYGLHTTKKSERDILFERGGTPIMVQPGWLQKPQNGHRPIIIEEGTDYTYEQPLSEFWALLDMISRNEQIDPYNNPYYERFRYKGHDPANRVKRLPELFRDIKENGVMQPVSVEVTGERLDGAFRTKIATYLGIKEVPAVLHRFTYKDIDDDFIERKLRARKLSSGKPDYYEFSYNGTWKNGEAGQLHRENADRWGFIAKLVKGSVVDIGCNEGYIGIQLARIGHKVWGIDHDFNHLAYLNKLIFEYVDQKEMDAEFVEGDFTKHDFPESDTVLLLNVIYHIPRDEQKKLLGKLKGRRLIFQCNLRKSHVRDQYYGSHPDDLKELLKGYTIEEIPYKDKPIIVCR